MSGHHSRTRGRKALYSIFIGALTGLLALALIAPSFAGLASLFENDGNLVDGSASGQDWASLGIDCTSTVKVGCGIDKPTGQGDDSLGQGTKEDTAVPSVTNGSIPNNKSDLLRFYVADATDETTDPAGDEGDVWLFLAWERVQDPTGTTNMDFEFNQLATKSTNGKTPVRSAGDILIKYDLSNGGTNPTMGYHEWETATSAGTSSAATICEASSRFPCWDKAHTLGTNFAASINTAANNPTNGSVVDPIAPFATTTATSRTLGVRTFGEAAVNLTDASILPEAETASDCKSFGAAYLKSRSSDTFSSAIKDFIEPIPIEVTNCSTLQIRKTDSDGAPLAGAKFRLYQDDADSDDDPAIAEIDADDPDDATDTVADDDLPALLISGSDTVDECETTVADDIDDEDDGIGNCVWEVVAGKDYWIEETVAPDGFTALAAPQLATAEEVGETLTVTIVNSPAVKVLNLTKLDDNDDPLEGVGFSVYEASDEVGNEGAFDETGTLVGTCTTDAEGVCLDGSDSPIALQYGLSYWVVETDPLDGYANDPDLDECTIGEDTFSCAWTDVVTDDVTMTFNDPREFRVLVFVCQESTDTLYQSDVTLDGGDSTLTASTEELEAVGLDETDLCQMTTGASFGGQQARAVTEPQDTTPATVYIPLIQN